MKIVLLILAAALLTGCALTYTTDGKNSSFSAGFNPDASDFKAVRELRR
jgi:outer membrane biogenesis lipoprotein LolB